jgi:ADP-ribosylation factor GTPase-activating protein 1
MVDAAAATFFCEQQEDAANAVCCDNSGAEAQWASVSHGIYIGIGASGVHRSLGVKTSRVLSTTMDSWQPVHLRMMQLGGNQRFKDFFREHGIPEDMQIRQKYSTRAAEWYRRNLRAEAEGTELPEPLPVGTGHLPAEDGTMSASTNQILDAVFAKAPLSSNSSTGQVRNRSKGARRSVTQEANRDKSRDSSDGNFMGSLASVTRQMLQGHFTARRLQKMSSGSMEGFGDSSLCGAAKKFCTDATRTCCAGSGLGFVASVAAALA